VGKYSETMKRMPSQADALIPPPGRPRDGALVDLDAMMERARLRDGFATKTAEDAAAWPRPVESVNVPAEPRIGVPAEPRIGSSGPLVPVPVPNDVMGLIASTSSIRQLSERLAPAASVDRACRLVIAGCRQQDGASSVAAAIAIDLSQRLSISTLLVDANLRNPGLHRVMASGDRRNSQALLDGALQVRSTGWRRLSLASCSPNIDDGQRDLKTRNSDEHFFRSRRRPRRDATRRPHAAAGAPHGSDFAGSTQRTNRTTGTCNHYRGVARGRPYGRRRNSQRGDLVGR
jgi:hypothetical protein